MLQCSVNIPSCTGLRLFQRFCYMVSTSVRPFQYYHQLDLRASNGECWEGLYLEKPKGLYGIVFIQSKAVVNASRQDKKISRRQMYTNPLVRGVFCCTICLSFSTNLSLSVVYTPRTSKNPEPDKMQRISSSSCMCLVYLLLQTAVGVTSQHSLLKEHFDFTLI